MRLSLFKKIIPVFLTISLTLPAAGAGIHNRHVLYISSYNPAFPTFFQQVDGIRSAFDGKGIILDIEFMDAKRFAEAEAIELFHPLLTSRMRHLPRYDAIIVADDAALRYAVAQQDKLFKGIPVFFCGINDIPRALSLENGNQMRGTVEAVSMRDTLELVKRIFPGRTGLAVITDGTVTGQADLRTFERESQGIGLKVEVLSLEKMTFGELDSALAGLDGKWAVLLLSCYTDMAGATRLFDEEFEQIMTWTKVPVFHLWEHGLGNGVFGGKIISHREQGRAAAEMVLKYFDGIPVADIRVITESPNRYMFDYIQLKRFNVSLSALPDGSIIVNKPHSFIDSHPQIALAVSLSVFFMGIITLIQVRKRNHLKREVASKTSDLVKSNERLHAAMKNANQTLWEWNIVNDDFLLITSRDGVSPEGLTMKGEQWRERTHPDDRDKHLEVLERYLKNEIPSLEVIHRIRNLDDRERWFITRGWVSKSDDQGKPVVISGISTDITKVKEIEAEISSSRKMLQLVLDTIPLGVFWKDLDLVYTGCNDQFARSAMLSSPAGIIGKRDGDLHWKEQSGLHERIDREVISSGKKMGFYEEEMSKSPGEKIYYRKLKAPLTDNEGKVIGILGIQEDVTEARRLREQRVRMQKLESVGILAGGLAHDFNNMLMGIAGSLAVLKLREQDEKKLHWITQAEKSCSAAAEVTSRLITFARGGDPVMRAMDISGLISAVLEMDNASGMLEIKLDIADNIPQVMGDERQLGQVLRNLLENAREAVASGGNIDVSCGMAANGTAVKAGLKEGRYVQVMVHDTGRGIGPESLGKIFDPYFSTKEMGSQKGQGLGLTICHSIIKNHGGVIFAESDPARGTTFTFLLPAI